MIGYKQEFEKFEKEFLGMDWKVKAAYREEAGFMISDINYFREHMQRTKKTKRFCLDIQFGYFSCMYRFVNTLFEISPWNALDLDDFVRRLEILDITEKIFDRINYGYSEIWITKAIQWEKIVSHFTCYSIKIKDYISAFIGSSYWCAEIERRWNGLEEKKEQK